MSDDAFPMRNKRLTMLILQSLPFIADALQKLWPPDCVQVFDPSSLLVGSDAFFIWIHPWQLKLHCFPVVMRSRHVTLLIVRKMFAVMAEVGLMKHG